MRTNASYSSSASCSIRYAASAASSLPDTETPTRVTACTACQKGRACQK